MTLAFALLAAQPAAAKLYKWTDEHGNVHYSDTVPPNEAGQGREVKSDSGQTVDKVAPPPTKEELEQKRKEQAHEEAERRQREEQSKRDRVLLMSYSSVKQIERTRDQRLETLKSRIQLTQTRVDKLQQELERQRERAAAAERTGRGSPESIHERIEQLENQIQQYQSVIDKTRQDMASLRETFAKKIERYRELTKDTDSRN